VTANLRDYGLPLCRQVTRESVVHVLGNVCSVPVAHVGCAVTVRVHAAQIVLWRDGEQLATHSRAADGAHQRVIDPAHYAPAVQTQTPCCATCSFLTQATTLAFIGPPGLGKTMRAIAICDQTGAAWRHSALRHGAAIRGADQPRRDGGRAATHPAAVARLRRVGAG
jgi:hypothetical protein